MAIFRILGQCTSDKGRFLKFYFINILDNIKRLPICFPTFGVSRSIYVLDPENSPDPVKFEPDPGLWGFQRTFDIKSMKTKKKALKIVLNIHSIEF